MNLPIWIACLCALGMIAFGRLYLKKRGASGRALALKGGTTLIAAIPALYAANSGGGSAAWWILAGILACAAADVILEINFQGGMLAFALGHVCLIAAFASGGGIGAVHLIAWVGLALWAVFYVNRVAKESSEPRLPFLLYGVIISAMLAAALTRGPLVLLGALLFAVSDSILLWGLLKRKWKGLDTAVMVTYWGAQFLLGVSGLF